MFARSLLFLRAMTVLMLTVSSGVRRGGLPLAGIQLKGNGARTRSTALALILLSLLVACDRSHANPRQSPSPAAPTPPAVPAPAGFLLAGMVFEEAASGRRPVAGGNVFFWLENSLGGQVAVDTSGRYTISGLPDGRLVRVTWTPLLNVAALEQRCPANAVISGDTEQDIEVARRNSSGVTPASPRLSGVVFEETPNGRRPLVGTRVLYSINNWSGFDAYTQTDVDGHYELCRIPRGAGRLGAGDCNDAVLPSLIDVKGDTIVNIDLTSFNASCSGVSGGMGPPAPR